MIKILLLLILSLNTFKLFPQLKEFEIKEREAPQFPAVFVNYPDDAAVIIYSSIRDLNFESNIEGIVTVRAEADKYSIIVKTERQIIKVKKAGFIENRISVPKLNSKEVRYFSIEEKAGEAKSMVVSIEVDPSDAVVYSDGKLLGAPGTHTLAFGVHRLRIEKKGFKTTETDIEVDNKNIVFRYKLEKTKPVILEVRSEPDKAKIFIDNMEEGETNDQLFKMPGKYEVKITKQGFIDYTASVEVRESGKNAVSAVLEKSSVTLRVNVEPSGAKLLINKKSYASGADIELAPGGYMVEIEKAGYDSYEENITLERGKPLRKNYKLARQVGSLQIKVKPIEADVQLSMSGESPISFTGSAIRDDLPAGNYTMKISAPGYETQTKNIIIAKNETTVENIVLTEMKNKAGLTGGAGKGGCGTVFYEGKTYNTVQIGNQCWLKENLNVGMRIDGSQSPSDNATIEKYCYDDNESNCNTYGGLYNWNEAMQYSTTAGARGICPEGWHLPTNEEYQTLELSVGKNSNTLKAIGQGSGNGAGTNSSGFSTLLAGDRDYEGDFYNLGGDAYFWSSSVINSTHASYIFMVSYDGNITFYNFYKDYGFSVRCIKD